MVNLGISTFTGSLRSEVNLIEAYTASLKGAAIVSSSQQIQNYNLFAQTSSANTFYGNQTISGSLSLTGSLKLGDWQHGAGVANNAKLDIRTVSDRGLKVDGLTSADVIITAYQGAVSDKIRSMRLEGSDINIYTGDGNANTGSYIGGFNTNGLAFANGKGIDFSATSNGSGTTSSELLNDYEEGTFTPTFVGTNLTISSYGNRAGFYTKIGRLVTVTINIMTEGLSASGAQAVRIGGLPFTAASTAESTNSANIFNSARWTANPPICGDVGLNTTEINLYSDRGPVGAGTDPTTAKTTDMAIGTGNRNMVRLTATYFTA